MLGKIYIKKYSNQEEQLQECLSYTATSFIQTTPPVQSTRLSKVHPVRKDEHVPE